MYSCVQQVPKHSVEFFSFDRDYLRNLSEADPATESHFTEYFSVLLSIKLRQRVRTAQEVEDLRQEVFLRVLRSLRGNSLEHPERLGAFVNSVCNHVLLEHFRAQGRTEPWDDDAPEPRSPDPGVEQEVMGAQSRRQVQALLQDLPQRDRAILRAIFFEERDKDSVCREYGVQRDYLRVMLHRAKNRLRALVQNGKTMSAGSP